MEDEDFLLALRLQEQFDQEISAPGRSDEDPPSSKKRKIDFSGKMDVVPYSPPTPERPLSVVDETWETLDPNPDLRAMFLQFNDTFFWGKLSSVEVKWSTRMTLCAGVCAYEGKGGLCAIRLSEPLLKLRPRKDLVQTLLHEMIHALLFVTQNNRDRDGHGPEFCKHMDRINQACGTKITIYHSFHNEVEVYRQHWWRCNGPCQNHGPFFGYVKRAMNRPPSLRDPWWAEHERTCGGTYTKIKEPENYRKTGKSDKKKDKNASSETSKNSNSPSCKTGSGSQDIRNVIPFSGRGHILGGNMKTSTNQQNQSPPEVQPKPLVSPGSPLLPGLWPIETNLFKRSGSDTSNVPRKKSVGNTKAFINVSGSPVRISKGNYLKGEQRSVRDFFQVLKSPERTASAAGSSKPDTEDTTANPAKCNGLSSASDLDAKPFGKTSLINNQHSSTTTGPKAGSTGSNLFKHFRSGAKTEFPNSKSKAFGSPQKSATSTPGYISKPLGSNQKLGSDGRFRNTGSPQSSHASTSSGSKRFGGSGKLESNFPSRRSTGSPWTSGNTPSGANKRSRDHPERSFDYFQQTIGESATSAVQQREEVGDTVLPAVYDQQANDPPVQITVHCPVCHIKVPEFTINEHLDSCL